MSETASIEASIDLLLGTSAAMSEVRRQLVRLARLDTTVLLTGRTGTGKGLAARVLHGESGRPGAFVHADCASLPPTLFESELFGHERGAFTGAHARRVGRLERSAAGTLFLDEIGELPPALQARLLRVLQDRRFERVGGGEALPMRGRVVTATSRDLPAEVRAGRFRADLYFRIAVVPVSLPPLAARPDDVELLCRTFASRIADRLGLKAPVFEDDAVRRLETHPWPGNVREFENAMERLVIRCSGRSPARAARADVDAVLELGLTTSAPSGDVSHDDVARTLAACDGNVTAAARRLGLARTTLRRQLAQRRVPA